MDTETDKYRILELHGGSEDGVRWNKFLQQNRGAHFYQQYEWKAINENEFGHQTYYLAASGESGIAGVFPMVLVRSRLFGRILCSMPFVNFGGPAVDNDQAEKALLDFAFRIASQQRADYLEIRGLRRCAQPLPTSEHKVSLMLELNPDADTLWNAFKSKHRTNIRRVYKEDVQVVSGQDELLNTFYDVMVQSWRALGTPIYRKRYFRTILRTFGDQIRIFVAFQKGVPVGTAFNGYFKDTVEGMWAGGVPEYRKLQANYVLYWEMIKDACERGFRHYHLGRSTAESGGEAFKKKWNGESHQLYWQYFLPGDGDIPQLNVTNPKYQVAIAAWQRLPLWATRTLGPWLSKSIP